MALVQGLYTVAKLVPSKKLKQPMNVDPLFPSLIPPPAVAVQRLKAQPMYYIY